jgi:hypothetical protein
MTSSESGEPDVPEPQIDPEGEPHAATAGEDDHENVDQYRGGDADPPRDPDEPFDDVDDIPLDGDLDGDR